MNKRSSELSAREGRTRKNKGSTVVTYETGELLNYFVAKERAAEPYKASKSKIDYSDIPPLTNADFKRARRARVGRPPIGAVPRKLISLKIDPFVLNRLKKYAKRIGKGYQTLVHDLIVGFLRKKAI